MLNTFSEKNELKVSLLKPYNIISVIYVALNKKNIVKLLTWEKQAIFVVTYIYNNINVSDSKS